MTRVADLYRRRPAEQRFTLADLWGGDYGTYSFGGNSYRIPSPLTTMPGPKETIGSSFEEIIQGAYRSNGVVFACVLARLLLFQEARFQYQRINTGKLGDLFGTAALAQLERPAPGKTTRDLLVRAEQDAGLAGNYYLARRRDGQLRRLRPDWVTIIQGSTDQMGEGDVLDELSWDVLGYIYQPGGLKNTRQRPTFLLPDEVVHWAPIPDPTAGHRGMSWLTPICRNVESHNAATLHKVQFFQNAATPQMIVAFKPEVSKAMADPFIEAFKADHQGAVNAYKTLFLGAGADATVVGSSFEQMSFKETQGTDETLICAAAGVPPIIVGVSEGLQSATYSNYGMARRKFGDHWARPTWGSLAASLEQFFPAPDPASRLWYDDRNIAFLREDRRDEVEIAGIQSRTLRTLLDAGFHPDAAVAAAQAGDMGLLLNQHSGLFSVQLQKPGSPQAGSTELDGTVDNSPIDN